MPIHDWTRVEAGVFHAFHHRWISAIADALNAGLLPADYYALPEQVAGRSKRERFLPDLLTLRGSANDPNGAAGPAVLTPPPKVATDSGEMALYRRKQNVVSVRHASGDRPVAAAEIEFSGTVDDLLSVAVYSADDPVVTAYVEPLAVGDSLPEVTLFLEPGRGVMLPLEPTYQAAWAVVPRRWRAVIEG